MVVKSCKKQINPPVQSIEKCTGTNFKLSLSYYCYQMQSPERIPLGFIESSNLPASKVGSSVRATPLLDATTGPIDCEQKREKETMWEGEIERERETETVTERERQRDR